MKKNVVLGLFLLLSVNSFAADSQCKTLKSCILWVSQKTGSVYNDSKYHSRNLKLEKEINLDELNPDTLFTYILTQNDFTRVKRDNGAYDIVSLRDIKEITFPIVNKENLKPTFDFQALEFSFSNPQKVRSAIIILKKYISKNARIVESADGTKVYVTDTGVNLISLNELIRNL